MTLKKILISLTQKVESLVENRSLESQTIHKRIKIKYKKKNYVMKEKVRKSM